MVSVCAALLWIEPPVWESVGREEEREGRARVFDTVCLC